MRVKLLLVLLFLIVSTSVFSQSMFGYLINGAKDYQSSPSVVDIWETTKTIDSYKIDIKLIKYSDGSYDLDYENRAYIADGYMNVDCDYNDEDGNDKIRCDYEAFKSKKVDTSYWWSRGTSYTYEQRNLSGFFTLERQI